MRNSDLLKSGAVLASAAAFAVGCGNEKPAQPVNPRGSVDTAQLEHLGAITIKAGESKFIPVITKASDPGLYKELTDFLPLVDHQNRHGQVDPKAPTIGFTPVRFDSHVRLTSSKNDAKIENDFACDDLNIEHPEDTQIGAIALSQEAGDAPLIVWPEPGFNSDYPTAYLCFAQNREPANGTILYLIDK